MCREWSSLTGHEGRAARRFAGCAFLLWILSGSSDGAQVLTQPSRSVNAFYLSASGATAIGFPAISLAELEAASGELTNFDVEADIRPFMARMWRTSPAFRRQCARIAEASVTVVVERGYTVGDAAMVWRPMTQIRRVNERLIAHMWLGGAQFDYSEYIAHELEHVLEQIDGVDLPTAAASGVRGVHAARDAEAFETNRAIAVGRLVAHEVRSGG